MTDNPSRAWVCPFGSWAPSSFRCAQRGWAGADIFPFRGRAGRDAISWACGAGEGSPGCLTGRTHDAKLAREGRAGRVWLGRADVAGLHPWKCGGGC